MSEMIGFIGLGHLGLPMATNLLNAGYGLRVYNRTASNADSLVARERIWRANPLMWWRVGGLSRPLCGMMRPWKASS